MKKKTKTYTHFKKLQQMFEILIRKCVTQATKFYTQPLTQCPADSKTQKAFNSWEENPKCVCI